MKNNITGGGIYVLLLHIMLCTTIMVPSCDAFLQRYRQHHQQQHPFIWRWEDIQRGHSSVPVDKLDLSTHMKLKQSLNSNNNDDATGDKRSLWDGMRGLWDEIIEVSTYGPSERRILKAQRERQKLQEQEEIRMQMGGNYNADDDYDDYDDDDDDDSGGGGDDQEWIRAFQSAKENKSAETESMNENALDYDGYAMRDLLVSKWGVPLDVDFQRIGGMVYCTVLPLVGYGSPLRSRHDTELDYLMHLQGIVEILYKYDNLDAFVIFIETTNRTPKRGTDSVPFRLNLNKDDIDKILLQ